MLYSVVVFTPDRRRISDEPFETFKDAYFRYCDVVSLIRELSVTDEFLKVTLFKEDRLVLYAEITGIQIDDYPGELPF